MLESVMVSCSASISMGFWLEVLVLTLPFLFSMLNGSCCPPHPHRCFCFKGAHGACALFSDGDGLVQGPMQARAHCDLSP